MNASSITFAGLFLALIAPVLAYVNGGDFHHTLHEYRDALRREGWAVCTSQDKADRSDSAEEDPASQLIGRSVQQLPAESRDKVSLEAKRELAKIAAAEFKAGHDKKEQKIVEGRIGNIRYRLGTFAYESYWETNYQGGAEKGRRIHELRKGLGAFVALQVVAAEESKR